MHSAAQLASPALDPFGSAMMSMRWSRPAAEGLLLVPAAACVPCLDAVGAGVVARPSLGPDASLHGMDADEVEGFDLDRPIWHALQDLGGAGLHGAVYEAREDAGAIVMLASPFAATLACTPAVQYEGIPFFHPMVALAGRDRIDCCPAGFYAALQAEMAGLPVGGAGRMATHATQSRRGRADRATGAADGSVHEMILDALGEGTACLVAHYGLLALGDTPEAAALLAKRLEALCQIYWQVLQVGSARAAPIPAG